jgi:membrane-bound lytic murein transglycosylase MltF
MQLIAATAHDLGVDAFHADTNIQGGIKYDRQMWDFWRQVPGVQDHWAFTWGSYNAGPGNIQKAYKLAHSYQWQDVAAKLPAVTGTHALETTNYVKRIWAFYEQVR